MRASVLLSLSLLAMLAVASVAMPLVDSEPELAFDGEFPSADAPAQESPALLFQAGAWPAIEVNETEVQSALLHAGSLQAKKYVLYTQCDGRWAKNQLGTSRTNTICSAGCAMSSLSMALASSGVKLNGAVVTPASLNSYLRSHGGYVSGDLLVWTAADRLGGPKWQKRYSGRGSMSAAALSAAAKAGKPVIVNVRNGGHWVLVTGPSSNGRTFPVNDPGLHKKTYEISEMSNFVVYSA